MHPATSWCYSASQFKQAGNNILVMC
uniref:Uncharacterized protein n=1 Tax=Arundo donax TaxID=35708 RepID=A0A0A8ZVQ9_ARUDO